MMAAGAMLRSDPKATSMQHMILPRSLAKVSITLLAVVAAAAALTFGPESSDAASTPCHLPGALGGGPSLASTLSVTNADGSVASADGTGYQVCITPNGSEAYSIVVALADDTEDLGTANLGRTFTITFSLPEGDTATSAELYADVQSYAIGTNARDITLVLKPVAVTSGTAGDDPTPLQDSLARITGGIRFNTATSGVHGIVGMWIGASANRYSVTMSGSCPSFSTGSASTSTTPGAIEVRLWAPHLTAGTLAPAVVNSGSLRAFIPEATASACFGGATLEDIVVALEVARTAATEGTTSLTAGSQFTASVVTGGLLITVPTITFSSPTYRIAAPRLTRQPAGGSSASATVTRKGSKATVTVVVPAGSKGKRLVIAEKIGVRFVARWTGKAKAGTTRIPVTVKGLRGKATLRVTLAGKTIATLKA